MECGQNFTQAILNLRPEMKMLRSFGLNAVSIFQILEIWYGGHFFQNSRNKTFPLTYFDGETEYNYFLTLSLK
jgi:hypothetical protein